MDGGIEFQKPWGEVAVHATMAARGTRDLDVLNWMMENDVPQAQQVSSGELRASETVIYWRVGPSARRGTMKVALARRCERLSEFDNYVSFTSVYPGNPDSRADVANALQAIGRVLDCLPP
jgi:hypothetical protein